MSAGSYSRHQRGQVREEISDPEKASEAAQRAIAIAQTANLPLQEAQGYYEWGMSPTAWGDTTSRWNGWRPA